LSKIFTFNPTWICLIPKELQIIGQLATRYDAIVVEELAYLTMDFRQDYSVPVSFLHTLLVFRFLYTKRNFF
jgi:hypothetical protein